MRRPRPAVVIGASLLVAAAAVATVAWRQRDFWSETAAHYLRERLARDYGAEFQADDLRVRWLPPALSFGRVTFHRRDEPWVLTADDIRVSFNFYAILFGRERLGKVILVRPHLFVRQPAAEPRAAPAPAPEGPAAQPAVSAPAAFLRLPLPFRALEVEDGRVEFTDRAGRRYLAEGLDAKILVLGGRAQAQVKARRVAGEGAGRTVEAGAVEADAVVEEGRVLLKEASVRGEVVNARVKGTATYAGALALDAMCTVRLERLAALLRPGLKVGGTARLEGRITGLWDDPAVESTLAVRDPAAGGRRWPDLSGRLAWRGRKLTVRELRVPAGEGTIHAAAEVDFSGAAPAYRLELAARGADLSGLAAGLGAAARVRALQGSLQWEGVGLTGPAATGRGTLSARLRLEGQPGEEAAIEGAASLAGGALEVERARVAARGAELRGSGRWQPGAGFAGKVEGEAADVRTLLPGTPLALDGRAVIGGTLAVDAAGPRFAGEVHLEKATAGKVAGIDARASVEAGPGAVRISGGALAWPGGAGTFTGSVELPGGRMNVVAVLGRLDLGEAGRLAGLEPGTVRGAVAATVVLRGTPGAPEVSGRLRGGPIGYRKATLDTAACSFTYAGGRFGVTELRVERGATALLFHGELGAGGAIAGEFESTRFEIRDFLPDSGVDMTGSLRGSLGGTLREPALEGRLEAGRLRYAGWDFKAGVLELDYRGGKAAVTGWVADEQNRFRAVFEPAYDWRFEADLELKQFAPDVVRSGLGTLPPALASILGRTSFLAAGRLHARGKLRAPSALRADLVLDTLWFSAAGKSLQNAAPVRISWRDGELVVEEFRVAGDQYHLDVKGRGSPAAGWALTADGAVNLALFREGWSELQEVDGLGEVRLTLGGPWLAPLPQGSIVVSGGFVKVRSLGEPLENLAGRLELQGRTLTASGVTGVIAGNAFRGGGSYGFADGLLDASVEGRLDLSLFRARVPAARDLRGPVDVRLTMRGPIGSPAFAGRADVVDAEFFVRPVPAKITHVKGRVLVAADGLKVHELTGQVGGGVLRLSGAMEWGRAPARVDFDVEGRGILISLAGAVKAQTDLRLGLHGDFAALRLGGEVHLLKGRYALEFTDKPAALLPAGAAAEGAADRAAPPAGGGRPDLGRMALDLKIRAADNVWIENKTAKIEAAVAIDVGGTVASPVVRGEIQGIQGEAYYLSRLFRLESGSLRFVPPARVPQLDVQASTTIGDTQVLFLMDGPLTKLSYHVTSSPPMSQEDLMSLLTIGQTRASIAKGGERGSALGAAVFSSEPIVNALGDEARRSMGVETLNVEPVVGENNEVSARVTVGTHLSDRLFVSYSKNLGATEDQQVKVEYHLLDYLSLWGQEMRQGVYSLDLVFRYAFR